MGYVHKFDTDVKCAGCGRMFAPDTRYPSRNQKCRKCVKARNKVVKRIDKVTIISFLVFPIGLLLYFLWKDTKPHLAKPALRAALIPIRILGGIFLFFLILYVIVKMMM